MKKRLKSPLAMFLMTACAFCGFAGQAQAEIQFTASSYPAVMTGEQTTQHVLTVQGQKLQCKKVHLVGQLISASNEFTVFPSYSECSGFGAGTPKVEMNGCHYRFTVSGGFGDYANGSVHMQCPEGKAITIVNGTCTIHIPAQTPTTSKVDYKIETGATNKIRFTWTVEGQHSTVTSGSGCPFSANATDASGIYTGATTFAATEGQQFDLNTEPEIEPLKGEGFTTPGYPEALNGEQAVLHVLTIQGHKVECKKAVFSATIKYESPELEVFPEYSECNAFGYTGATVSVNDCRYFYTIAEGGGHDFSGGMQIKCPVGNSITISAGPSTSCVVHIPAQQPTTNSVDFKVETGLPDKVLFTWTVQGIHSVVTKNNFLCPLSTQETDTTGKLEGTTLMSQSEGGDFDIEGQWRYTASSYPTSFTGSHTAQHVLGVQGKTVKCNVASSTAELAAAATKLEVGSTYGECTAFGISGASFNTNGCEFVFDEATFVEAHKFTTWTSVKCPAGKEMVIKAENCEALIPSQGPLSVVTLTNMTGSPNTLTAKTEISGLIVNAKSGAGCPLEEKAVSNATYTGVTEFKGAGGVGVDVGP